MTIEVSLKVEAQLKAKAQAEGLSLGAYIERLIEADESRQAQLDAFQQAIAERVASLNRGESVDGGEVMDRLIAELDVPGLSSGAR
jgi:hypothetical protein